MTIIAVMRESPDSLLIGADSGETSAQGLRTLYPDKLQRHPTLPLVWATTGYVPIGADFSQWLAGLSQMTSWEEIRVKAREKLNMLYKEQVERSKEAINLRQLDPGRLNTGAIIAGWIADECSVVEVDGHGTAEYREGEFCAVGSGEPICMVSFKTLEKAFGTARSPKHLRIVLEITATSVPGCDLPVHVWRIKKTGIEELKNED